MKFVRLLYFKNSSDGSQTRRYGNKVESGNRHGRLLPSGTNHRFLFDGRNYKDLPGIDKIRILEHGFVGFKDYRIFLCVTVNLPGDL